MMYWSKAGYKYHAYDDCQYIKGKALITRSIDAPFKQKGVSELCKVSQKKSAKSYVPSKPTVGEMTVGSVDHNVQCYNLALWVLGQHAI
ncbi:MAG: hypothetical protein AB8F78_08550 [Saprospiraceae bacterium]